MSRKGNDPHRERQRQMKHRARAAERRNLTRGRRQRPAEPQAAVPGPTVHAVGFDMTAVLLELIDPILHRASDTNEAEIAVLLGITAWNFTNLPPEEGRKLVETTAAEIAQKGQDALKSYAEAIASLILRKQMLFSQLDTIITDYEIRRTETGFDLKVAHAPLPK